MNLGRLRLTKKIIINNYKKIVHNSVRKKFLISILNWIVSKNKILLYMHTCVQELFLNVHLSVHKITFAVLKKIGKQKLLLKVHSGVHNFLSAILKRIVEKIISLKVYILIHSNSLKIYFLYKVFFCEKVLIGNFEFLNNCEKISIPNRIERNNLGESAILKRIVDKNINSSAVLNWTVEKKECFASCEKHIHLQRPKEYQIEILESCNLKSIHKLSLARALCKSTAI